MTNDRNLSAPQKEQLYGTNCYLPDEWSQCEEKPTKLYQLDFYNGEDEITSPQSSYFIDEDTYNSYLKKDEDGNLIQDESGNNIFDVQQYCNDAQIAPYLRPAYDENGNFTYDENGNLQYADATYKNNITCYDVSDQDLEMWEGHANANEQYGTGGAKQYFVPQEDYGKLTKDDNFISPTIPEEDRYVDLTQAKDAISKGTEENQNLRGEIEQSPMQKEGQNADEISNQNNGDVHNQDTLKNVANESNLPSTTPSTDNSLKNDQNITQ